jgi:hypothetical protein
MAGMNVVAIEKNEYMICAIKARAKAIMTWLENSNFNLNTWLEKLEKSDVGFGGSDEQDDDNGSAGSDAEEE